MKRKALGLFLAFTFMIALLPLTASSADIINEKFRAACGAYCGVLTAAIDEYGLGQNPDTEGMKWYVENGFDVDMWRGVNYAELIWFDKGDVPQLLFIYSVGGMNGLYFKTCEIYGFSDGKAVLYGEFTLGGEGGYYSRLSIVTDQDGLPYFHVFDSEIGDFGDLENDTYYTVRNGQWFKIPEGAFYILNTRALSATIAGADSVNTVLKTLEIYSQDTPSSEPAPPPPPANVPSDWAITEVNAALAAELVPDSIANAGWQNATSRIAAADAIVLLIEKASGKTMAVIAAEFGWDLNANQFADTSSHAVTFLKYAGVTTGVGNNRYDPGGDYNRAQIVTMLGRAAEVFFGVTAQGTNPFNDVPDWAAPYVGYAADNGVTQGAGDGMFDSFSILQNQQTAVFCRRAFDIWV